jgi:signal peptidase I
MTSPQSRTKEETSQPARKKTQLRETIVVVLQALVIALVFRSFIYQPFLIPTASMQSTLLIGDYVMASKFSYGYGRWSLPFGIIPFSGRVFGSDPARGDIVVFYNEPTREDWVKRVIGLPGDRIQMQGGRLYINGEMVPRELVGRGTDTDSTGRTVPVSIYRETLPNGVVHTIQEISDSAMLDDTGEYVVPDGHYFMMGDNRDRSADSRVLGSPGYVPAGNLIGKAEVRFFSIENNVNPWFIWQWPGNVRWDRMFQSLYE